MYTILEIQTNDGETSLLTDTKATKDEALSKYHSVLSFAAVSEVQIHTCIVIDEQGQYIARESFDHRGE